MPAVKNTASPYPFQSLQHPLLHSGIVAVTGSLLVDLGINHNNFVPSVSVQGGTAAIANNAPDVTWAYGTKPGTFTIFTWKATAAGTTTLIAATVAVNVSFVAIVDSSVG
jgi:hypothetical protein